jgi:hypothetical protein
MAKECTVKNIKEFKYNKRSLTGHSEQKFDEPKLNSEFHPPSEII